MYGHLEIEPAILPTPFFKRRDWMVEPIWGSILAELVFICSSCVHDSFQTIFTRSPLPHNFWCQSWSSIEIMASRSWSLQGFTSFSILNYLRFRIDKWDQTSDIQDSQVQYRVSERYEFDPLPGILMLWSPWSHTRTLIRWRFAWDLQFNCQPFLQFDRVSSHVAPFVPWTSHQ